MQTKQEGRGQGLIHRRWGFLLGALLAIVVCATVAFAPIALADDDDTAATPAAETPAAEAPAADAAATPEAQTTDDAAAAVDAVQVEAADVLAMAEEKADDPAPAGCAEDSFTLGNDVLWFGNQGSFTECIIANDLIGAGETITVNDAQIADDIRMSGRVLTVSNTSVAQSATLAGQSVSFEGGSAHVVAMAGQDVVFSGTTDKLYLAGSTVRIDGVVNGDVRVKAGTLELGPNAVITGTLMGTLSAEPTVAAEATVGDTQITIEDKTVDTSEPIKLFDWRMIAASIASCLLMALLTEWIAGDKTVAAAELLKERPGSFLLSGLLGTILTPLIVALLCVPVVTIPAAIALLFELIALALASGGFTSAVLARLLIPGMGRYISAGIFGVLVGALMAMPFVGTPLRGVVYAFTLGYFICSMRKGMAERRNKRNEEVVQF